MNGYRCERVLGRLRESSLGVYKIQLITKTGEPVPISRLRGVDRNGILSIGCSPRGQGIPARVRRNIKKHVEKPGRENTQRRINANYDIDVKVAVMESATGNKIEAKECNLLARYKKRFGEYPPWNEQGGRKKNSCRVCKATSTCPFAV